MTFEEKKELIEENQRLKQELAEARILLADKVKTEIRLKSKTEYIKHLERTLFSRRKKVKS